MVKVKDIRRLMTQHLKAAQSNATPGRKTLSPLQAKMHYLKTLSEMRSFGGKCFLVTIEVKAKSYSHFEKEF